MNYTETLNYLYSSTPVFEKIGNTAYKEGLYNSLELDRHLGHPHQQFKSIHVAGTNGKGSTSHTLAAILQANGYKVGLYTSPHLVDFRERIRVNGRCIEEGYVIEFVQKHRSFFEPLHPSFFELTTALAFQYFADKQVDIAVIEVGLGGRLDCTNIITPILSVITNIGIDHTQFLGTTLPEIAAEKAGIIESNVPVVIGETLPETRVIFSQKAEEKAAPVIFAEENDEKAVFKGSKNGRMVYHTQHFGTIESELTGFCQVKNTNTILCAAQQLETMGIITTKEAVKNGFLNVTKTTGLMGRWQTTNDSPLVICDTGHNADGWKYLSQQLSRQKCENMLVVFGMVDDKDVDAILALLPRRATYFFTQADTHRAIPARKIQELALQHHLTGETFNNVEQAYQTALRQAQPNDFIFVGGSSYIVADFLTMLQQKQGKRQ